MNQETDQEPRWLPRSITVTFPTLRFARENNLATQLEHINQEHQEFTDAYFGESELRTAEELFDLVTSGMTGLTILAQHMDMTVEQIVAMVQKKNKARGYEL